jgi:hypothetical protein
METKPQPYCTGCDRTPEEIEEYVLAGEESGLTPTEYVVQEEGTLNPANHHFLCTDCYIEAGMPTRDMDQHGRGWYAP